MSSGNQSELLLTQVYAEIGRHYVSAVKASDPVDFAAKKFGISKLPGSAKLKKCNPAKSHFCLGKRGVGTCVSLKKRCRVPLVGAAAKAVAKWISTKGSPSKPQGEDDILLKKWTAAQKKQYRELESRVEKAGDKAEIPDLKQLLALKKAIAAGAGRDEIDSILRKSIDLGKPSKPNQTEQSEKAPNSAPAKKSPEGSKTSYAKSWEVSWDDAPESLKDVIRIVDQPGRAVSKSLTAHYSPESAAIHMAKYKPEKEGLDRAVWRHEYGHHLDSGVPRQLGSAALSSELERLGGSKGKSWFERKELLATAAKNLGVKDPDGMDYDTLSSSVFLAKFGGSDPGSKGALEVSSSKDFNKAVRSDESRLLEQKAELKGIYEKGFKDYKKDLPDMPFLRQYSKAGASRDDVGRHLLRVKALEGMESELSPKIADGIKAAAPSEREQKKEAAIGRIFDKKLAEMPDSTVKDVAIALRKQKNISLNEMAEVIGLPHKDPELLSDLSEKLLKAQGVANDLIGSATYNKLGGGHTDAYYAKNPVRMGNTEVFANVVCIHGSGHPLSDKILRDLAPETYSQYNRLLELAK